MVKTFLFIYNFFIVKKLFLFCLVILSFSLCTADDYVFSKDYSHSEDYHEKVPALLQGIWQGEDRLVLFSGDNSSYTCILRVFYKWYDDRASEPSEYSQISTRDRNNTTALHPENIDMAFKTIIENTDKTAGAFEIRVKYPGLKDYVYIPVAVINGNLYLRFYYSLSLEPLEEGEEKKTSETPYYLIDVGTASGITISPPVIKKELLCFYSSASSVYHIRYWLSDMEETDEKAEFLDGADVFNVPKYIQSSGKLYTCTTGRSHRIRNIQKSPDFPKEFISDSQKILFTADKPYLVYVNGSGNHEKIDEMVKKNNSRIHPAQKPPFPVSHIDFHWKEISELEKYNPYTWNKRNLDIHK